MMPLGSLAVSPNVIDYSHLGQEVFLHESVCLYEQKMGWHYNQLNLINLRILRIHGSGLPLAILAPFWSILLDLANQFFCSNQFSVRTKKCFIYRINPNPRKCDNGEELIMMDYLV